MCMVRPSSQYSAMGAACRRRLRPLQVELRVLPGLKPVVGREGKVMGWVRVLSSA